MRIHKTATLFALVLSMSSASAADAIIEPWVQQCSIDTSEDFFVDADAEAVAGGIILQRIRKHQWCKLMAGVEGVLVVHPLSQTKPCKIRYRFSGIDAREKSFVFKSRGSDVLPGVIVKIKSKNKILKVKQLGKDWEIFEIPATDLPAGSQDVTIEIHAVGWNNEYTYIDFIGFR